MIQGLRKTISLMVTSIHIAKTVWNATLQFLRYEIERKWVSFYDTN